jgi:AsmA protein
MHPTGHTDEADLEASPETRRTPRGHRRLVAVFCVLVAVLLLTFIPPLFNVGRFHRRIADNIGAALGRPVHFDDVSLRLLPVPGFTLKTFVIDDDPAFGSEPVLRANQVQVTLRVSSLWQHAEFSKIALTEPSVNLVRAANGRWNIEGLLLQASHIQAAPTDQRFAGPARRFPYIEATGARLNLKLGQEKTPFSLTDADFSLWLPEPHQWRLRLEAHPMRTDTSPGDTGTIRIEGTLGSPAQPGASLAEVPVDLHGDWRNAQLGGIGRLVLGRDPALRGDVSASFGAVGTIGHNAVTTSIKLAKARRAEFVPAQLFSLEATCSATAGNTFHAFSSIECHWPPADSSGRGILILTADVPDVRQFRSSTVSIAIPALPAESLFDWLSVVTPHPLAGTGTLAGTLAWNAATDPSADSGGPPVSARPRHPPLRHPPPPPQAAWSGELELSSSSLELDRLNRTSIPLGDVTLRSTLLPTPQLHSQTLASAQTSYGFDLLPIELPLGGKQPATLEGHFDAAGYTLHLTGTVLGVNLLQLGNALPQFGDGLEEQLTKIVDGTPDAGPKPDPDAKPGSTGSHAEHMLSSVPIHVDLTATRAWGSPQVWHDTNPPPARPHRRK